MVGADNGCGNDGQQEQDDVDPDAIAKLRVWLPHDWRDFRETRFSVANGVQRIKVSRYSAGPSQA
jgi:hypothetical protein